MADTRQYFKLNSPAPYVCHVEINRPEKMNSFHDPMWGQLRDIFDKLSSDPQVRAIVLSGAGDRAFTAGLDVQAAAASGAIGPGEGKDDPARRAFFLKKHIAELQDSITAIERCTKPVIVVLHGYALGLAIDISSSADIRIAAANTAFSVREVEIGLAADIGTLTRLPKLGISLSWVKEVCLSARIFKADEAQRVGFVSEVLPDKAAALKRGLEVAANIASKSPVAVQGTKHIIDYSRDHAIADGLAYTTTWNAAMLQTEDVTKAMMAGLQKKKTPEFSKL